MLDGSLERFRDGALDGKPDDLLYSGAESDGLCDGGLDLEGLLDGIEVGGLMHLTPLQISPGQHCGEAYLYLDPHCVECLPGRVQYLCSSDWKEKSVCACNYFYNGYLTFCAHPVLVFVTD